MSTALEKVGKGQSILQVSKEKKRARDLNAEASKRSRDNAKKKQQRMEGEKNEALRGKLKEMLQDTDKKYTKVQILAAVKELSKGLQTKL